MEEIIDQEMKSIMDIDKTVQGVLLADQNGHPLYNLNAPPKSAAFLKQLTDEASKLKLPSDNSLESARVCIETVHTNVVVKNYDKYTLGVYKAVQEGPPQQ